MPQLFHHLVQLLLGPIDLRRRPLQIEQPGADRDRELIHVSHLRQHLVRHLPQRVKAPLFGHRAMIAVDKIVSGQLLRECQRIVRRAAAKCRAIGNPGIVPCRLGEPEAPDILDAVMRDAQRDVDILAVDGNVRDVRWLLEVRDGHADSVASRKRSRAEKSAAGCSTNGLWPQSSMTTSSAPRSRATSSDEASGTGSCRPCVTMAGQWMFASSGRMS